MKLPLFSLSDTADGREVWKNESTRTTTETDLGGGFKMTSLDTDYGFKSEGSLRVGRKKNFYYSLGTLSVPAESSYSLTMDNVVMRADTLSLFRANPREFQAEFITSGRNMDMTQIYYSLAVITVSAFLLFLTGARGRVRVRRKR